MIKDGVNLHLLEHSANHYGTMNGELWEVNDKPFLYHHWHGTHLKERQVDFPNQDLLADKNLLFSRVPWRIVNNML